MVVRDVCFRAEVKFASRADIGASQTGSFGAVSRQAASNHRSLIADLQVGSSIVVT
jgi:hypothetical protein